MKRITIFFIIIITLSSCVSKSNFTVKPQRESLGLKNLIKLDGAYIGLVDSVDDKKIYWAFYFYNNSIALLYGSVVKEFENRTSLEILKDSILYDINFANNNYRGKEAGFKITDNKIEIQILSHIRYGGYKNTTFHGEILNDSIIYISSCKMKKGYSNCRSNFYLKFTNLPKPDSTNQWMKKKWYWKN